jgi:uncharacterized protein YceK
MLCLVAHQTYKGCSSWIKKAGTSDSATNAERRFKYEKEKRPEWTFNAKWCEGRPWLKNDHDENFITCIQYVQSMVNEGKLEI